jgi:hypothetical protein
MKKPVILKRAIFNFPGFLDVFFRKTGNAKKPGFPGKRERKIPGIKA